MKSLLDGHHFLIFFFRPNLGYHGVLPLRRSAEFSAEESGVPNYPGLELGFLSGQHCQLQEYLSGEEVCPKVQIRTRDQKEKEKEYLLARSGERLYQCSLGVQVTCK